MGITTALERLENEINSLDKIYHHFGTASADFFGEGIVVAWNFYTKTQFNITDESNLAQALYEIGHNSLESFLPVSCLSSLDMDLFYIVGFYSDGNGLKAFGKIDGNVFDEELQFNNFYGVSQEIY